jgi:hypothetical protein
MEVVRYGHRAGVEVKHECCVGGTWYVRIAEGEMAAIGAGDAEDVVLCEVKKGDVLFINNVVPHRSLNNLSDHIRWSLDLRWQRPQDAHGFWGLKAPIVMSKAGQPDYAIDWTGWADDDRQVKQMEAALKDANVAANIAVAVEAEAAAKAEAEAKAASDGGQGGAADPFDTVIAGPWMARWDLVHHNKHVDRFVANQAAGKGSDWHAHVDGAVVG